MSSASLHISPDTLAPIETELKQELKNALLSLSYHAFEHLIRQLLERMGYSDARILTRRSKRGRHRHGGRDLEAVAKAGVTRVPVIIQAKQYERVVSRRFVDELRGAMLRLNARHGLLITTSRFSPAAHQAASRGELAPVHLLDGETLILLLCRHRIGVCPGEKDEPELDGEYFRLLQMRFPEPTPARRESVAPSLGTGEPATAGQTGTHNPRDPSVSEGGGMMWRTHALLAINTLWLLTPLPGAVPPEQTAPLAIAAAIGALLPDLDSAGSRLSTLEIAGIRPLQPLARIIQDAWGHRGRLHSLLAVAVLSAAATALAPIWGWRISVALVLGYMSHLAGDAMTRTGIPLLYPSSRRYFLLPRRLRLVTGSDAEDIFLVIFAAGAMALFLQVISSLSVSL